MLLNFNFFSLDQTSQQGQDLGVIDIEDRISMMRQILQGITGIEQHLRIFSLQATQHIISHRFCYRSIGGYLGRAGQIRQCFGRQTSH